MHFLSDKLGEVTIYEQAGVINVQYVHDNGFDRSKSLYQLAFDEKVYKKLTNYKTVRGLLAYCGGELDLVYHLPHDFTDHTRTVTALPAIVSEQETLPSEESCAVAGNSSPVAVSVPTTSDTPFCPSAPSLVGTNIEKMDTPILNDIDNDARLVFKIGGKDSLTVLSYDLGTDFIKVQLFDYKAIKHEKPIPPLEVFVKHAPSVLSQLLSSRNGHTLYILADTIARQQEEKALNALDEYLGANHVYT